MMLGLYDDIDYLGESPRDKTQIEPTHPQNHQTDQDAYESRRKTTRQETQKRRKASVLSHQSRGVATDGGEGHMTKRE